MRSRFPILRSPILRSPVLRTRGIAPPAVITVVMIVLLSAPLVAFRYLPLQDMPNHQARLWLETSLARAPELARYFRIAWQPAPALALDLTITPLATLIGTEVAMRVFLVGILVMLAVGLVLVNRSVARRAHVSAGVWPVWPLAGLLFFYNKILTFGFLSFLGTAAAGLLVIALGLNWRGRHDPWRVAILTICALALLFGHGHAFACTGLALAAAEFAAQRRAASSVREIVIGVGVASLPFVLAVGLFLLLPGRYSTGHWFQYNLPLKLTALGSLLELYDDPAEIVANLGAAAAFLFAWSRGWIIVPSETRWMAGALFVAFLILPFTVGGSSFADFRLPIFIVWVLIAGSVVPTGARPKLWLGAVLLALTTAQVGYIATRWSAFQPAYAAVDAALDRIEPGARVLTVSNSLWTPDRKQIPPLLHAPQRAVWRRHAFVSGLFLNGGVPVKLQPDTAHLGMQPNWWRPIYREDSPSEQKAFFDDNRLAGYDYLLVLLPGPVEHLIPGKFHLVTKSRWVALYDMRQPRGARHVATP